VKRLQELFHPKRVLKYCLVVGTIGAFVGWRLWFQGGPPKFQDFDNPPVFAKTWLSKVHKATNNSLNHSTTVINSSCF